MAHGHAVGSCRGVAGAGEDVGAGEREGEEGADCHGEDGWAHVLGFPEVVAGEEGAEELCVDFSIYVWDWGEDGVEGRVGWGELPG